MWRITILQSILAINVIKIISTWNLVLNKMAINIQTTANNKIENQKKTNDKKRIKTNEK